MKSKIFLVGGMITDPEVRNTSSLPATATWAVVLTILGLIFLPLCATGVYPTSVATQKEYNFYSIDIANYSLYVLAGLSAFIGVAWGRRTVRARQPTGKPRALLVLAVLAALSSLGLSFYVIYGISQLDTKWYTYLIDILIILQRCLFLVAAGAAVVALAAADKSEEVAAAIMGSRSTV